MKNLFIMYSGIFSILYLLYTSIVIFIISKCINFVDKNDVDSFPLTEDDYFVLSNKYDVEKLFYYITYKLYAKKILLKDTLRNKFYVNDNYISSLTSIEEEVYKLYLNRFAPKDFKINMINESIFKNYYDTIYTNLKLNGFIKENNLIKKNKVIFILGLLLVLAPGIYYLIYCYINEISLLKILVVTFILIFIYTFVIKNKAYNILTLKGMASKISYHKNSSSIVNSIESDTYIETMNEFLVDNSWMYFLGLNHAEENDDDDCDDDFGDFDD